MATQKERREAAIARLLDASIDTIVELGYAKASADAIAKRAGLSHGALFRHFENMGDFMAATANEALRRQLADFDARVAKAGMADVTEILGILRAVMGSTTNAVLYELTNAARTDKELQRILQAGAEAHFAKVQKVARSLPGLAALPEEFFATVVLMVSDMFDAEAMMLAVRPLPADEIRRRDDLMSTIFTWAASLGDSAEPTKDTP